MVKMSPFVVSVAVFALVSVVNADVSHLTSGGYQYANLGLTSTLKLHTPESPAPTQYISPYGDGNVANSYVPPPSGSPFASISPLPVNVPSKRLSVPLQSPVFATQSQIQSVQPNYQQFQRTYQPQAYQQTTYKPQVYQPQAYQPQTTFQSQAYRSQSYQQPQVYQSQPPAATAYTAYTQAQVQTQAQTQAQSQSQSLAQTQAQSLQNQGPIITKHFYVHAAPEEPEEKTGPRYVQIGRARKNYKIIFIKPPTYDLQSQIIPVIPPTEEKTIVYVLSKKPTLDQNIQLPEQAPTEPSKPDVFFIKYKTQQEADQAQQSIQAAYNQANLASANGDDQVSSKFASDSSSSGSSSAAFGGQDSTQPNYQQTSQ